RRYIHLASRAVLVELDSSQRLAANLPAANWRNLRCTVPDCHAGADASVLSLLLYWPNADARPNANADPVCRLADTPAHVVQPLIDQPEDRAGVDGISVSSLNIDSPENAAVLRQRNRVVEIVSSLTKQRLHLAQFGHGENILRA